MGSLGLPELIIVAIIALLIFGPKKLPDLGAGLGKAIRDFKGAINDSDSQQEEKKKEDKKEEKKDELQPKS
jgi:sec-independent protein translocase protein TatA